MITPDTYTRIQILQRKSHRWLMACAMNITKELDTSKELVSDLYMYLLEKDTSKFHYEDSYNLKYLRQFLKTRYLNRLKHENRSVRLNCSHDIEDEEYDIENDKLIFQVYDEVVQELKELEKTKIWVSSRIYQMYINEELTMAELAAKIGISKSTTFLHIKKIKDHLKSKFENRY